MNPARIERTTLWRFQANWNHTRYHCAKGSDIRLALFDYLRPNRREYLLFPPRQHPGRTQWLDWCWTRTTKNFAALPSTQDKHSTPPISAARIAQLQPAIVMISVSSDERQESVFSGNVGFGDITLFPMSSSPSTSPLKEHDLDPEKKPSSLVEDTHRPEVKAEASLEGSDSDQGLSLSAAARRKRYDGLFCRHNNTHEPSISDEIQRLSLAPPIAIAPGIPTYSEGIPTAPKRIRVLADARHGASRSTLEPMENVTIQSEAMQFSKYAILSHTWRTHEVSYEGGLLTQAHLQDPKFQGLCDVAREYDCRYVWIDTVCINKSSSSELEESIQSMYTWYKNAHVCFVYLSTPSGEDWHVDPWFIRGWTLQELLAPLRMVFYTAGWERLFGTSHRFDVVRTQRPQLDPFCYWDEVPIIFNEEEKNTDPTTSQEIARTADISAQDMETYVPSPSHATTLFKYMGERQTTAPEDMAYCLLGLLNISLPIVYGEGEARALHRLQVACADASGDRDALWGSFADTNASVLDPSFSFTNCGLRIAVTLHDILLTRTAIRLKELDDKAITFRSNQYGGLSYSDQCKLAVMGTSDDHIATPFTIILQKVGHGRIPRYRRLPIHVDIDTLPPLSILVSHPPEMIYQTIAAFAVFVPSSGWDSRVASLAALLLYLRLLLKLGFSIGLVNVPGQLLARCMFKQIFGFHPWPSNLMAQTEGKAGLFKVPMKRNSRGYESLSATMKDMVGNKYDARPGCRGRNQTDSATFVARRSSPTGSTSTSTSPSSATTSRPVTTATGSTPAGILPTPPIIVMLLKYLG
ncbi:hypothetical protein ONZ45_g10363 [Pleurotus djamor]|nr:hypothetical protein ONZ45_g10363 [Pleurotus djamor]